ncbi:MAG: hypothetical protein IPK83_17225 [Planctomycetes bacterium]|nr:hypothetical protein [Planctomycetota bacterium]
MLTGANTFTGTITFQIPAEELSRFGPTTISATPRMPSVLPRARFDSRPTVRIRRFRFRGRSPLGLLAQPSK